MNQGGVLLIASIVGLFTYAQAKDSGWKAALGELFLAGLALVAFLWLDGSEFWASLSQRTDFPKIMFFIALAVAGTVFAAGELLRRRLQWNLLPRHAGWIVFVGSYVLLNILFLTLGLKEPS